MSNKPILFYSHKCKHSIILWQKLKEMNILENIEKINIHKPSNKKIPMCIKSVPTLIINDRSPIEGDAIIFYFNTYSASQSTNVTLEKTIEPSKTISNSSNDIKSFLPGEMGNSWSDKYSYISNSDPIHHSYLFLDSNNQSIKISSNNANDKNNKRSDIDKKLEALKLLRQKSCNAIQRR